MSYESARASGASAFVRCFKITRADAVVVGATDHDRDITFEGVVYRARAALDPTEMSAELGLAPDELDAQGALRSDDITEADLLAGFYDGAAVEVWDVSSEAPADRKLRRLMVLGEVERGPTGFRAEIYSRQKSLQRERGRVYTKLCDAELGDTRCGVDVSGPAFTGTGIVTAGGVLEITATGLTTYADNWFDGGVLTFTSGALAGEAREVRVSRGVTGATVVKLWRALTAAPAVSDAFSIRAGCSKDWDTCGGKFGNRARFRGFPFMIGQIAITVVAREGDPGNTGGSYFDGSG